MAEPSWQDLYDIGKATLQSRRPKARVEEGDVYDAILAGAASMALAVIAYANALYRKTFLDGAKGQDLTDLAHDRGVDRYLGSPSVGKVTFSRVSFAASGGTLPAGFKVATQPDSSGTFASFVTTQNAVFNPTDLTVTVDAECTNIGKIGNVDALSIDRITNDTAAFDSTITVSNAGLFTKGTEQESDEDLRDRVRNFFLTQARGTIEALILGAKNVEGVTRVTVSVDSSGVVTVFVADEDGNSNATMIALVSTELEEWRAAGDVIYVTGGVVVNQTINISLTVKTGVDATSLFDNIRTAVVSLLLRLNPGQVLYKDAIRSAVRRVDPEGIVEVIVNTPPANVAPNPNELLRTNNPLISFS